MKRKFQLGIVLIGALLCLFGCADSESKEQPTGSGKAETTIETPLPTPKMETITVFTIDPSSMSIMPSRVKKEENNDSLSYIVDLVLNNIEDEGIKIAEVKQEDGKAIISFASDAKPVVGCDEEMENLIFECFANSILDNVEGIHDVIYRTDKGPYKSENTEFGKDEVYASR